MSAAVQPSTSFGNADLQEHRGFSVVKLTPTPDSDNDLKFVQNLIESSYKDLPHSAFDVYEVYRIINPTREVQFYHQKMVVEGEFSSTADLPVERWLFHGTGVKSLELICREGLNRSVEVKHGALYGNGTYFTNQFPFAMKYAKPEADRNCYMFVCRVLTGDYTQGEKNMSIPPLKPNNIRYHSLVNSVSQPSIFVTFNDNASLPVFLIVFRLR